LKYLQSLTVPESFPGIEQLTCLTRLKKISESDKYMESLPTSLNSLIFRDSGSIDISYSKTLTQLTHLKVIIFFFDFSLGKILNKIPLYQLKVLNLCSRIARKKEIEINLLPFENLIPNLKRLDFSLDRDTTLKLSLPTSVDTLGLNFLSSTLSLDGRNLNSIPSSIKHLIIPIEHGFISVEWIPSSVKTLTFKGKDHSFTPLTTLPPSVEQLNLMGTYSTYQESVIDNLKWRYPNLKNIYL